MDRLLDDPLSLLPGPIVKLLWPIFQFLGRYRRNLWVFGVLVVVLLLAPMLGVLSGMNYLYLVAALAVPLTIASLYFVMPRPKYGPVIILFAALFIPLSLPTGTESRLVDSFLLTLFFVGNWLAKMIFVDKKFSLAPAPANKPLLGFAAITFFSIIWSGLLRDPLADPANLSKKFVFVQIASALTMVMLPGVFLLVVNYIRNIRLFKWMVALVLVGGVLGIAFRFRFFPIYLVNDDGLFTMWVVVIATALVLFNNNIFWGWKVPLLLIAGGWVYFRFVLQVWWMAGWLPSIIVLAILAFMRSKKLFAVVLVIAAIYVMMNSDYYFGTVLGNETNESGNTRMTAWEMNWTVTGKHLLFGTGPAGYAVYYMSYFPNNAMATHNNVIDILAQTGIFGLAFVFWFFITLIWQGYKVCVRLRGRYDFVEALANISFAGSVACLVMMMFGDWLFPFTYTQTIAGFDYVVYSWLFMAVIPVLDLMFPAEPKAGAPAVAHS